MLGFANEFRPLIEIVTCRRHDKSCRELPKMNKINPFFALSHTQGTQLVLDGVNH